MTGFQPPCSDPQQGPGGAAQAGAQVAPPCLADLSPEPALCPPRAQGPEPVCGLGDLLTVLAAPPPQNDVRTRVFGGGHTPGWCHCVLVVNW